MNSRHNPEAIEEIRSALSGFPELLQALEKKLEQNNDSLTWAVQINGDHLHSYILAKGPSYWYGIKLMHEDGTKSKLTRVCDYLGIREDIEKSVREYFDSLT